MGREIRRVPKGWEHPQHKICPHWQGIAGHSSGKCYIPMYDQDFDSAVAEWEAGQASWDKGEVQSSCETYLDYAGPKPSELERQYYRPAWKDSEATCFQIYETVSEGTPVSPIFETLIALEDWLVNQGYSRKAAHNFCESGWVPSMIITDGEFYRDIESASLFKKPE